MVDATVSLGELVAQSPARARVFEALGLDYCCGGRRSLERACREKGLAVSAVAARLERCDRTETAPAENPAALTPAALADHIEAVHHDYLFRELPRIEALAAKVAAAHGEAHPELIELHRAFGPFREELERHMLQEECVVFPWVRAGDGAAPPVDALEDEHEAAGAALEAFRRLTAGYRTPADGCATYRALMDALAALERDMHQHVHLENNVLFPRVLG